MNSVRGLTIYSPEFDAVVRRTKRKSVSWETIDAIIVGVEELRDDFGDLTNTQRSRLKRAVSIINEELSL